MQKSSLVVRLLSMLVAILAICTIAAGISGALHGHNAASLHTWLLVLIVVLLALINAKLDAAK